MGSGDSLTTAERHAREEAKPERLQAVLARSCVVALLLMV